MTVDQATSAEIYFSDGQALDVRPCSGVWGGVTPAGLIQANFFTDVIRMPTSILLRKDPTTGEATQAEVRGAPPEDKAEFIRQFVSGVVMRPEDAMTVGQWLIANAAELITLQGGGVEVDFNGQKVKFGAVPEN